PVGRHPTGLAWDERGARLYVANGNSDTVSVIDTRPNAVVQSIAVAPFRERKIGLAPTAVALSPDARTLYVALGGINAVAVVDVGASPAQIRGLLPCGWYPARLDASGDGRTIAVGTLLGVGSGTARIGGKTAGNPLAVRGSVNVIDVPTDAQLAAYTTAVAQNNRLSLASGPAAPSIAPRANVAA